MPQFPSLCEGCDVPAQLFIQAQWEGGGPQPSHALTALLCLSAAGRGGGEHFPGVIRGGAVNLPEPALPHRLTVPRPRQPGERDGEKPTAPPWLFPPPSSAPSSLSDNGSTGKWPNLGGTRSPPAWGGGAPTLALPSAGFWGSPTAKGVPGRARAGTPHLCCPPPPSPNAVISPIPSGCCLSRPQHPALPQRPLQGRDGGSAESPPNTSLLCSGLLRPRANPPRIAPSPGGCTVCRRAAPA